MRSVCLIFKKKWMVFAIVLLVVLSSVLVFSTVMETSIPKPQYTVVIDAGHGGLDVK